MGSATVVSHWHRSVSAFNTSTLDFYRSVETTLKAKEAPAVRVERITAAEGGIFSAKREYLRIQYGKFTFDICAAPFGKDFFFSWWLIQPGPGLFQRMLLAVPFVGQAAAQVFKPTTYFSEDARLIFEEAVHTVVVEQVGSLLTTNGIRALTPEELKPESRKILPA